MISFLYYLKKYYLYVIIVILVAILFGMIYFKKDQKVGEITENNDINLVVNSTEEELIKVDIKGYIKKPGVYEISKDTNVSELIKIAGGLKSGASTSNINLARTLTNEAVVIIKSKNELKKSSTKTAVSPCVCDNYDISNCTNTNSSIVVTEEPKENNTEAPYQKDNEATEDTVKKVSINTGTKEELMTLSGIGESKALAIIKYRTEVGLFKDTKDITSVSGISETIYEKIKDNITI